MLCTTLVNSYSHLMTCVSFSSKATRIKDLYVTSFWTNVFTSTLIVVTIQIPTQEKRCQFER